MFAPKGRLELYRGLARGAPLKKITSKKSVCKVAYNLPFIFSENLHFLQKPVNSQFQISERSKRIPPRIIKPFSPTINTCDINVLYL